MGRNGKSVLLLLLLFVFDASLFGSPRKLVDEEAPKDNATTKQNPPSPSLAPYTKSLSDPRPTGDEKSIAESRESQLPNNNSSSSDIKGLDNFNSTNSPPPVRLGNEKNETKVINRTEPTTKPPLEQTDRQDNEKESDESKSLSPPLSVPPPPKSPESGKSEGELDKGNPPPAETPGKGNDDKGKWKAGSVDTCPRTSNMCRDEKSLVACTLSVERGSGKWLILVQNKGEGPMKANIFLPASMGSILKELTIPTHQSQRVNISIPSDAEKIIVDAGNGVCVLHMEPLVSEGRNILIQFPSYEKLLTPINGAYLLIFSAVSLGVTWAGCLFRKKRRGEGIHYQELEMGASEAELARDVETAEGWDEVWDDDWDEEKAVRSPGGGGHVKNISGNGVSGRASTPDGWENDWDDLA